MSCGAAREGERGAMITAGEAGLCGALPTRFPIFPLPGAILLPSGNLPLNIFEPRYLQMTRDAMRTDRVIGMVQPTGCGAKCNDLFAVGCVGRITSFAETGDGRYLITLTGVCRYDLVEELRVSTPYRQVSASFERWQVDLEPPAPSDCLRPRLLEALRGYFEIHDISCNWGQIQAAPLGGLITSLAMICPFEPCEKQALLEALDPQQRCEVLIALRQMGALGIKDRAAAPRH
jgi:Lon protease-like protein